MAINIDINKLSPLQTWFAIGLLGAGLVIGVLDKLGVIGSGSNVRDIVEKVDDLQETVDYINVEQSFLAEDVSEALIEQGKIKDSLKGLHSKYDDALSEQSQMRQDLFSLGRLMRSQGQFTPEQMEILLNNWLDENVTQPSSYSPSDIDYGVIPYRGVVMAVGIDADGSVVDTVIGN